MVILSAAVTSKNGRALLSRQFVDMNRLRVEGLLAAFPKLQGTGAAQCTNPRCLLPPARRRRDRHIDGVLARLLIEPARRLTIHHAGNKQHTFVETDSVRYVYQPVESIFLLLITNKASNIVEDLETLRLLSKVVPEIAGGTSEDKVSDHAFELVFAFDEVITTGGYRETIDMRTIRQNLDMDSHEEKLANMVKKSKLDAAKDQAKHMSQVIKQRQRDAMKTGMGGGGPMAGMGGGDMDEDDEYNGGSPFGGQQNGDADFMDQYANPAPPPEPEPIIQVQGMKLGKKKKGKVDLMSKMAAEDGLDVRASMPQEEIADAPPPPPAATTSQPIALSVEEKLTISLSQEGALEAFDLKGTLSLTANDDVAAACRLTVANKSAAAGTTFATHPKVDKKAWESDGIVQMKGNAKGFPVGRAVGVVRWALSTTDEQQVPLTINCWPEDEGDGQMNVNIEYTAARSGMELYDVSIKIPGCASNPEIVSVDGTHSHDARSEILDWQLDCIDGGNPTGTLEFNIAQKDEGAFFPIEVSFRSKSLYYDVPISSVESTEGHGSIGYSLDKKVTVDSFRIA